MGMSLLLIITPSNWSQVNDVTLFREFASFVVEVVYSTEGGQGHPTIGSSVLSVKGHELKLPLTTFHAQVLVLRPPGHSVRYSLISAGFLKPFPLLYHSALPLSS